jgi:putative transposase
MRAVRQASTTFGVVIACAALGAPRASYYRWSKPPAEPRTRHRSPRALTVAEREDVLAVLNSERFADQAPAEVYATLLDEKKYVCSIRTMYRVLAQASEVRERRDQLRHPSYAAPQLMATAPNRLWSWDITKLPGPQKWTYFYLYVILDVFSRYVVGWMVAHRESAVLARKLIEETCARQGIASGTLTLHADRGSSMRSKHVAQLLADLRVTKTHSRPYVSDDHPFSESQFKTMKYRPDFPERFGSIEDARAHSRPFFVWYNDEHHHSGLALFRPADVHFGRVTARLADRAATLEAARLAHPERFVLGAPRLPTPPASVWINRPQSPPSVVVEAASGVAEPPPEASVRPSPAHCADREAKAQATERPEPRTASHCALR